MSEHKQRMVVVGGLVAQLCLTLHDPMDSSLPSSKGFSRQEEWSRLPFPSPETEHLESFIVCLLPTSPAPSSSAICFSPMRLTLQVDLILLFEVLCIAVLLNAV